MKQQKKVTRGGESYRFAFGQSKRPEDGRWKKGGILETTYERPTTHAHIRMKILKQKLPNRKKNKAKKGKKQNSSKENGKINPAYTLFIILGTRLKVTNSSRNSLECENRLCKNLKQSQKGGTGEETKTRKRKINDFLFFQKPGEVVDTTNCVIEADFR